MKKIFSNFFNFSVGVFYERYSLGTETEIEGDVSTYASGTLIDSFNLSASRTN